MTTTIDTSTATTATGTGNQRKVDRCQNGILWACFWTGLSSTTDGFEFWHSADNGATWSEDTGARIGFAGTGTTYTPNGSLFIDLDDYAHFVYNDRHNGFLYYRRGTPNAGRTTYTWSSAQQISTSTNVDHADVTACRRPGSSPTTWDAFIVASIATVASWVVYERVQVANDGTLTAGNLDGLTGLGGMGLLAGSYAATTGAFPSVDFNHTGDGKTVAGSTPHLYAGWATGASGSGNGVRFKKATWSAGWTWGTERAIDTTRYAPDDSAWLNCHFDGTRVMFVGALHDGTAVRDLVAHARDAGDTATTTRVLLSDSGTSTRLLYGSSSYDANGDLYIAGVNQDEAAGSKDLVRLVWDRSANTLSSETVVDASVANAYVSCRRPIGTTFRLDLIYRDLNASPYNIVSYSESFNVAPDVPTWSTSSGVYDVADTLTLTPVFTDPDPGDTASAYAFKRDIGGTVRWWGGASFNQVAETWGAASPLVLAAAWGADGDVDHLYYVNVKDQAGVAAAAYSSALTVTPSVKSNPTLATPVDGVTYTLSSLSPTWTVGQETAYRLRLYNGSGELLEDLGWITGTDLTDTFAATLANGANYQVGITTKNTEGLESDEDRHSFPVTYSAPPTPSHMTSTVDGEGAVDVMVTNPAPSGGEPAFAENRVWRRVSGTTGDGQRYKVGLEENGTFRDRSVAGGVVYEYRIESIGDNGVSAFCAWDL